MATSQVGQQSFVIPAPTVKILPETLFGAGKEIERLQLLIEKKFKKEKKNVTDKN